MVTRRNQAHRPYLNGFRWTTAHVREEIHQCAERLAISRNAYYLTDDEKTSLESILQALFQTEDKLKELRQRVEEAIGQ